MRIAISLYKPDHIERGLSFSFLPLTRSISSRAVWCLVGGDVLAATVTPSHGAESWLHGRRRWRSDFGQLTQARAPGYPAALDVFIRNTMKWETSLMAAKRYVSFLSATCVIDVKKRSNKNLKTLQNVQTWKKIKNVCKRNKKRYLFLV